MIPVYVILKALGDFEVIKYVNFDVSSNSRLFPTWPFKVGYVFSRFGRTTPITFYPDSAMNELIKLNITVII